MKSKKQIKEEIEGLKMMQEKELNHRKKYDKGSNGYENCTDEFWRLNTKKETLEWVLDKGE